MVEMTMMRRLIPPLALGGLLLLSADTSTARQTLPTRTVGIVTGRPGRVYDDIGRGLADLLDRRLPRFFGPDFTPDFAAVNSTAGTLANAREIAKPGLTLVSKLVGRAGEDPRYALSGEGTDQIESRLGLVNSFALVPLEGSSEDLSQSVRGLAVLWDDYLHLVAAPHVSLVTETVDEVERPLGFETLEQLRGRGKGKGGKLLLHIGGAGSATRMVAEALLAGSPLEKQVEEAVLPTGRDLGDALLAGELDAAFILSGLPDAAVEKATSGGCRLLSIQSPNRGAEATASPSAHWGSGLPLKQPLGKRQRLVDLLVRDNPRPIFRRAYPGLETDVPTLVSSTILIATHAPSDKFTDDQAQALVRALFDTVAGRSGLESLLNYHEAAQEIRLLSNLEEAAAIPADRQKMLVPLHPGAEAFYRGESAKLKIAAGPAGSTSFRVGNAIAESLARRDIRARAFTTDGTKESAKLLMADKGGVDLAILQNDVAVASHVAGEGPSLVTFLYPEAFHFLIRARPEEDAPTSLRDYMASHTDERKIAMVKNSGDLDERILRHYGHVAGRDVQIDDLPYLPVAVAQSRLISGEIDAALIGSGVPMAALESFLGGRVNFDESIFRLRSGRINRPEGVPPFTGINVLPLDVADATAKDSNPAAADRVPSLLGLTANETFLTTYTIPPDTYPAVQKGPGSTVAVQTILACRENTQLHVYNAVSALIDDEVRLRREARGLNLRDPLERGEPSVPIHPDALRYYRAKNFVVRQPEPERGLWDNAWHALTGQALGLLAGIAGTILLQLMSSNARDWLQSWLERRNPANQLALECMLIHFGDEAPATKLSLLEEKRVEIGRLLARRRIRINDVERLDRIVQEYKKQVLAQLDDGTRPV